LNILSIAIHTGLSKPATGGRDRYFHIIQELKKHGNHIIVLEPQEFFDVSDLDIATIYTHPNYRLFHRGWNLSKDLDIWFITKIVKILENEQVDLIAIDYPSGVLAVKLAAVLTNTNVPIMYSPHNVESSFASDVISRVTQFSRFERKIIPLYITVMEKLTAKYLADHITAVSDADKDFLCSKYSLDRRKVTVIPSGCELKDLVDPQEQKHLRAEMRFDPDSAIIVFHGSYLHPPNREAMDTITDYIAPMFKDEKSIVFVLYGADAPEFRRANVRSFGFVEDLHQAISIADIALVPLKSGGGTKLKLFDYMNAGLPIITTRKGIEGIKAKDKEHLIIVENIDKEIVSIIKYLVQNSKERERLGLNARGLVENIYNWDLIGDKLDSTYRNLREKWA
jgi:glycosyltransferase involved in cell wall biosynthesis